MTTSQGALALPTSAITGHITVIDGQATTTTQDIAEVYGKRHDDVLRIVRQRMAEVPEAWRLRNFTETVVERPNPSGGEPIKSPVIRMTKKGFHFVVGKFTGAKAVQHQIAFADEFERMETELQNREPSPPRIDPAEQLLSGQCDLTIELPEHIQAALNARAGVLAGEAFTLIREHLRRRIAFGAVNGHHQLLRDDLVLNLIADGDLGDALAHEYITKIRNLFSYLNGIADAACHSRDQAGEHLKALHTTY
ncbi:transcriptional regulator [Bordetella phage vB_BaM-IFTN6]|nr:antirepressor [Bordetella phage vB_BaM-IFTN4]UOK17308.1 transcriptional regulator [Bordetella phage vB_BaM-IFTN5]UOK17375.1 transcriptional regulator [Bordetella phage vB_BaM-IFTN6]